MDASRFLQNIPKTPEPSTREYLFTAPYLPSLFPNGIFIRQCYFHFAEQNVAMLKQSSSSSACCCCFGFCFCSCFSSCRHVGSSGIGKTAFGYYLVYRLRREFPTSSVVWTTKKGSIYLDGNNVIQSSATALSPPVFHILDDIIPEHTDSFHDQLYFCLYSGAPTSEWLTKLVFLSAEQKSFYMPLWYYFLFSPSIDC